MATVLRTIDEIDVSLQASRFEVARVRMGDLRTLVAQTLPALPDHQRALLQPAVTYYRLMYDVLGDVAAGDLSQYDAAEFRRLLSESRDAIGQLHGESRSAGGQ
jgi:hypothetical protein